MGRRTASVSLVDKGLKAALRQGWDRGIMGGSDTWLVVGAMALLARMGRRAMHREVHVVYAQRLLPEDGVSVSNEYPD
jgi:hypothetical protein